MSRRRIVVHGSLRALVPAPLELEVATAAEAVHALTRLVPALRPAVGRDRPLVKVLGFDTVESLYAPTEAAEIHLVPAFAGGKSGFFKVLIGGILVAAAVALGPAGAVIQGVGAGLLKAGVAGTLLGLGTSLALGGLLELVSPAPKIDVHAAQDPEASKYLGTPRNTVRIGTRIPLLFGEHLAHGHILSFDVDAVDVAV